MENPNAENRLETARRVLEAYELHPATISFLQHSENLTYRVDTSEGTYLLRLHIPATAAFENDGMNKEAVNSEMVWLVALRKASLPVPQPVQTRSGEFVTRIDEINASLLKWQDGEQLIREMESEETAAQTGTLVGRLHQHSSRWKLPKGFTRPQRNSSYFENAILSLWPAVEDGRITAQDYKTLQTSVNWLSGEIRNLSKLQTGLLHGDLHRGNFLLHHGKIKLIDFSMSAFGPYAYDLGTCLSNVRTTYHGIFLEHYSRYFGLPDQYQRMIQGFFLGSYVVTFSLWISDPESQETLIQRVPIIAREFAARFNREQDFWFT